jgi:hypothetical protein
MAVELSQLSDEQILLVALDPLTRRDLINLPPSPTETMQHVGLGKTKLDGPIRSWINARFRKPRGRKPLKRGAISSGTTWSKLLSML